MSNLVPDEIKGTGHFMPMDIAPGELVTTSNTEAKRDKTRLARLKADLVRQMKS